jgi:hypothetical protein
MTNPKITVASKTTSIHNLNADTGLNKFQKVFYLLLNWANNLFPYTNIDNGLLFRDFTCEDLRKHWALLDVTSSPSRKLSDLFWMKLPWGKIREELNEINILDTGCGSGNYGWKLVNWSNNNIARYTGIDVYKNDNWTKLTKKYPNFAFHRCNANDILHYIPEGTNFFMSQSAIEHFDEDLLYFERIRDYILSYQRSVIQVHLFPSTSCLRLYRFHGVRQYTPRTVSIITKLFKNFSYAVLFKLGGKECNRLHYDFITKPLFIQRIGYLRDLKTQEYDRRLLMAIEQDMKCPQKFPAFYALVIHSNWRKKLFHRRLTAE